MKLVLMSPDMNLGWVMMFLNTGMLWLTPVGEGGGRRGRESGIFSHMTLRVEKGRKILVVCGHTRSSEQDKEQRYCTTY